MHAMARMQSWCARRREDWCSEETGIGRWVVFVLLFVLVFGYVLLVFELELGPGPPAVVALEVLLCVRVRISM